MTSGDDGVGAGDRDQSPQGAISANDTRDPKSLVRKVRIELPSADDMRRATSYGSPTSRSERPSPSRSGVISRLPTKSHCSVTVSRVSPVAPEDGDDRWFARGSSRPPRTRRVGEAIAVDVTAERGAPPELDRRVRPLGAAARCCSPRSRERASRAGDAAGLGDRHVPAPVPVGVGPDHRDGAELGLVAFRGVPRSHHCPGGAGVQVHAAAPRTSTSASYSSEGGRGRRGRSRCRRPVRARPRQVELGERGLTVPRAEGLPGRAGHARDAAAPVVSVGRADQHVAAAIVVDVTAERHREAEEILGEIARLRGGSPVVRTPAAPSRSARRRTRTARRRRHPDTRRRRRPVQRTTRPRGAPRRGPCRRRSPPRRSRRSGIGVSARRGEQQAGDGGVAHHSSAGSSLRYARITSSRLFGDQVLAEQAGVGVLARPRMRDGCFCAGGAAAAGVGGAGGLGAAPPTLRDGARR